MSIESRRNVAFIGHGGVGKTPLCEALVRTAGVTNRIGDTTDGSSHFDFEPEEIKRDTTLKTSVFSFDYKNNSFSILDTPGSSSFLCDTACAMRASDCAMLIISAYGGVKIQGKKAWALAAQEGISRAVFITDMNLENARVETALEAMKSVIGTSPVLLQVPMGEETSFNGVIDLLSLKAYTGAYEDGTKAIDIPPEYQDIVTQARAALTERIAETDDALIERYLEGQDIAEEELIPALKNGIATGAIVPAFFGAPEAGIGIGALLSAMIKYLPSPLNRTPYRVSKENGEYEPITPSPEDSFIGIVYKTFADPFTGQVSLVRVISGTLKSDDTLYNMRTKSTERLSKIHAQQGKDHAQIQSAEPGAIIAIAKLKDTHTGDTLVSQSKHRTVQPIVFPVGGMKFAIEPKNRGDEDKILGAIERIGMEDPSLQVHREPSTHETIVTCMSQQHMDITVERIKRKFNVEMVLHTPKVPYRETIKKKAESQGRHKKQSGGRGQFGDCWLRIEPLQRGEGFSFNNEVFGGAIPRNYIPAIEKGVIETMEKGVIAGFPMVDVSATVYDGSYHSVDSSDMAFKIAASKGFKLAVAKADPVLLEPVMTAEIIVPDDATGDVIGDLNGRRGHVLSMDPDGEMQIIRAEVPLSEMLTYTPSLRSMTSDRGSFSLAFRGYEEVPPHAAEKVIAEFKLSDVDEED